MFFNQKSWEETSISLDQTHHLYKNTPLYKQRFEQVLKFHTPGLASVQDEEGWYHININGEPAYRERYKRAFGFYYDRAAVETLQGSFHILPTGKPAYTSKKYLWCGNFQEKACVVKDFDHKFFHIDLQGVPLYDEKYIYAGDFKDGYAVITTAKGATHINTRGELLHGTFYEDLDVFHKGFARAKDCHGWFHIGFRGNPVYNERYLTLEPFYNGIARATKKNGDCVLIDEEGKIIKTLSSSKKDYGELVSEASSDLVGFWKTEVIYTAVQLGFFDSLPNCLDVISKKLSLSPMHTKRLLRALWELNIVTFKEGIWYLTDKGSLFYPSDKSFMASASKMWRELNGPFWKQLPHLIRKNYNNYHSSFKDLSSKDDQKIYYHALDGYNSLETESLYSLVSWSDYNNIVFVGRSSKPLLCRVVTHNKNVKATLLGSETELSTLNLPSSLNTHIKTITKESLCHPWKIKGDIIFFIRVLHCYPDNYLHHIISQARLSLNKKGKIIIIEMITSESNPKGALLDVNQFVESGGQLRTLKQWEKVCEDNNLSISSVLNVNDTLTALILVS